MPEPSSEEADAAHEAAKEPQNEAEEPSQAEARAEAEDEDEAAATATEPGGAEDAKPTEVAIEEEGGEEEEVPMARKRSRRRSQYSQASHLSATSERSGANAPRLYTPPTWMRRLLTNKFFLLGNAAVIMLNVIWTGIAANSFVSVERSQGTIQDDVVFFAVESLFTGLFFIELLIRLGYFASWRLWKDPWLCVDIVVIGCPAVEIWILRPIGWNGGLTVTVMNILRVFRVGRGFAMLANIKWFRPLYLSALGFRHSMRALLVITIYLVSLTFCASVVLCQLLGPTSEHYLTYPDVVRGRFRSVSSSFFTLTECTLGGIEWGPDLVEHLLKQDMLAGGLVLLSFLILASLLWLNIVAGLFMQQVDHSFEVISISTFGAKDKELQKATEALLKDFVNDLWEMDEDDSKDLCWRDISLVVTHHLELLADLGVRMPDARRIFQEMDVSGTGYVSISMFVSRVEDCLKYKTVDNLIFENQQSRLLSLMKKLARQNKRLSKKVCEKLQNMSASLTEVESEESLPQAVQRRIARQRQRVTTEREWMGSSDATMNDELSATSKSTRTPPDLREDHEILSGRGMVLECWKRSVQRRRPELWDMVGVNETAEFKL